MRALLEYLLNYFSARIKAPAARHLALAAFAALLLMPGMALATDRVVLRLYGADAAAPVRSFTLPDLKALPSASIETDLPEALQITGHHVWAGVPLAAILSLLGPGVAEIRLAALNDYSITIPVSDITTYQPILAYSRDGQDIAIRDKGPLIVIYPFGRYPELEQQVYLNRTIWQVGEIRAH